MSTRGRSKTTAPGPAPLPLAAASADVTAIDELRRSVQTFVRSFGLLAASETPCGQPIATSHAHALMFLRECACEDARPTQQELGRALGIDKSNVARLCRRMEAAGHLKQDRCEEDGRARLLRLTARGARLAEQVEEASRARFAGVMRAIPADARSALLTSLRALNDAVALTHPPRGTPEAQS